jgi:hypothetical protein
MLSFERTPISCLLPLLRKRSRFKRAKLAGEVTPSPRRPCREGGGRRLDLGAAVFELLGTLGHRGCFPRVA